jgi:hypothetical protein
MSGGDGAPHPLNVAPAKRGSRRRRTPAQRRPQGGAGGGSASSPRGFRASSARQQGIQAETRPQAAHPTNRSLR